LEHATFWNAPDEASPRVVSLARRIGAVGVVVAALVIAVPANGLAAVPPSVSCGQKVLRDWSDDGRIEKTFAPHCYREAIAHLPSDVRVYSSAEDDITQALNRVASRRSAGPARHLSSARVALAKPPSAASRRSVAPIAGSAVALTIVTWAALAARRRSTRGG
jgi:hypothetical protein